MQVGTDHSPLTKSIQRSSLSQRITIQRSKCRQGPRMSTDPTIKPVNQPAPVGAAAPPSPSVAPVRPMTEKEEVSFWQSFLLGMTKPGELPVYHHSSLFYWWPVWVFGLLFAGLTYFGETRMAIVPEGTKPLPGVAIEVEPGKVEKHDALVLPEKEKLVTHKTARGEQQTFEPTIYMSRHKSIGTFFIMILLVVIIITNITLRGLWSIFVLVVLLMPSDRKGV